MLEITKQINDLDVEKGKGGVFVYDRHGSQIAELDIEALKELAKLDTLINIPHTHDWLEAVPLEAAHQIARWGSEHDAGKDPTDWLWLLGYLAGKAVNSAKSGDLEKAKHHTISSAAVLLNWHRHLLGIETDFRPGIQEPK